MQSEKLRNYSGGNERMRVPSDFTTLFGSS